MAEVVRASQVSLLNWSELFHTDLYHIAARDDK